MQEKTDDEHSLTLQQIMHELEANDISAECKSLYDDFKCMDEHLGIEVIKEHKGRETYYHVESRPFELAEVKLFIHSSQDKLGTVSIVILIVQMVVLLSPYIPTEMQLKKRFSD